MTAIAPTPVAAPTMKPRLFSMVISCRSLSLLIRCHRGALERMAVPHSRSPIEVSRMNLHGNAPDATLGSHADAVGLSLLFHVDDEQIEVGTYVTRVGRVAR